MSLTDEQVLRIVRSEFKAAEKFRNQMEAEKEEKLSMLNGENEHPSKPPQPEPENEPSRP
jgi:hypothetical protein